MYVHWVLLANRQRYSVNVSFEVPVWMPRWFQFSMVIGIYCVYSNTKNLAPSHRLHKLLIIIMMNKKKKIPLVCVNTFFCFRYFFFHTHPHSHTYKYIRIALLYTKQHQTNHCTWITIKYWLCFGRYSCRKVYTRQFTYFVATIFT